MYVQNMRYVLGGDCQLMVGEKRERTEERATWGIVCSFFFFFLDSKLH